MHRVKVTHEFAKERGGDALDEGEDTKDPARQKIRDVLLGGLQATDGVS